MECAYRHPKPEEHSDPPAVSQYGLCDSIEHVKLVIDHRAESCFLVGSDLPTFDLPLSTLLSRLSTQEKSEKLRFSIRLDAATWVLPAGRSKRNDRSLRIRTFVLCAGPGASWTTSIATGARVGSSGRTMDAIYTRAGPAHHRTQTSKPLARARMRTRYLEFTPHTRADKHTRSGSPRDGSEKWVARKRMCEMF